MRNLKIVAVTLLASGAIFFGGCGYSKPPVQKPPQSAPVQENLSAENTKPVEHKQEVGEPLDTSIEVTKDEMDRFIDVAKNYKLNEGEVRRLVQIFKQVGMNFDPRLRISINPVSEQHLKPLGRIEYTTKGYTVECQYPGTKPQLIVDGIPRNARGYFVLIYGSDSSDSKNDFEIYFEFLYGGDFCPIYKGHRILNTIKSLTFTVADEAFNKMHDTIAIVGNERGKFIEIQKFYERALSRELTPEDYEAILSGKNKLEDLGITELENVTIKGVELLKRDCNLGFKFNAPCIVVFPEVIVESNVYGEGKKKFYGKFDFQFNGDLIHFTLSESHQK